MSQRQFAASLLWYWISFLDSVFILMTKSSESRSIPQGFGNCFLPWNLNWKCFSLLGALFLTHSISELWLWGQPDLNVYYQCINIVIFFFCRRYATELSKSFFKNVYREYNSNSFFTEMWELWLGPLYA